VYFGGLRGRDWAGTGEVIADRGAVEAALRALLARFPRYGRFAAIRRGPGGRPDEADLARAVAARRTRISTRPPATAPLRAARFGNLLLASLLTGNEVGTWAAVHPALHALPPAAHIAAERAVTRRYGAFMPALMTGTLASCLPPPSPSRQRWRYPRSGHIRRSRVPSLLPTFPRLRKDSASRFA